MLLRSLLLVIVCSFVQFASAAQVVTSGSGLAATTTARNAFRTILGGGTVAGANGSFGGVRREINWDGVPDAFSAPNNLPANFFNANSPRGAVFSTPGNGFQVSATAASGTPVRFGNINPTYPGTFTAFSPERLFTPLSSNVMSVSFFVPGTSLPATVSGFGAIFTDVDTLNGASLQFFDAANKPIGSAIAPTSAGDVSFVGVSFDAGERIRTVLITAGNSALGPNNAPPGIDVVAMDDFIYAEPQLVGVAPLPIPALHPLGVLLLSLLVAMGGRRLVRSRRQLF